MHKLYTDLAEIYEAMYQTFIDYADEFRLYGGILEKHGKHNILEIACGTGNLAPYFLKNGFTYSGLDFSQNMIDLAAKKTPGADFVQGDMRNFSLVQPVEGIMLMARSSCYMYTNADMRATFAAFHKNLEPGGILTFDFIDARRFIPYISPKRVIFHEATYQNDVFKRESHWTPKLEHGMDFTWLSIFLKKDGEHWRPLGEDEGIIRAFTKDEIETYLTLENFEILEMMDRDSYAFPTYVVVARALIVEN